MLLAPPEGRVSELTAQSIVKYDKRKLLLYVNRSSNVSGEVKFVWNR